MAKNARAPLASVDANAQNAHRAQNVKDSLKAWNTSILLGRPNYYGGRKIYMAAEREGKLFQNEESGSANSGSKRPHSSISEGPSAEMIDDDGERLKQITDDCDQVRAKVRAYMDGTGLKAAEFQRLIGVSPSSYRGFMEMNGIEHGKLTKTYKNAFQFFKKRDIQGLEMPAKKPKIDDPKGKKKTNALAKAIANAKQPDASDPYDVSGICIEGEEEGDIEIYETCDSLRRMISAYLRQNGVTQASFLRHVSKQFGNEPRTISSAQLSSFMKKNGPLDGNSSGVFYGAYVYLEKLRIKQKKPKSKFRLEMEEEWEDDGGVDREQQRGGWICPVTTSVSMDKYGRVKFYQNY